MASLFLEDRKAKQREDIQNPSGHVLGNLFYSTLLNKGVWPRQSPEVPSENPGSLKDEMTGSLLADTYECREEEVT